MSEVTREVTRLPNESDVEFARRVLHGHEAKNLQGPIVMVWDKFYKGSIRYAAKDDRAPVQSLYVSRDWKNPMPKEITVEIK